MTAHHGWKMLPADPTQKMIAAFESNEGLFCGIGYEAMLAAAPAVTVTEEMVERAAEVIAGDAAPVSFCRHTARIALERALKSTTPQTGSQE